MKSAVAFREALVRGLRNELADRSETSLRPDLVTALRQPLESDGAEECRNSAGERMDSKVIAEVVRA